VFIDEKDGNMVSLKPRPGAYNPLFVPMGQVFEGDQELFSKLKSAYESNDMTELHYLWEKAKPLTGAV
jgi:hypothetical protein